MSETQSLSFELLDDPTITTILFGGSAGGAKSFLVCMWAVIQCRMYKGIVIGLGRKELSRLRKTTLVTLLHKVHPTLGIGEDDYKFNGQENYVQYSNGSRIVLIDMAFSPSDPDFDKFGSLELTHVIIEEVGEAFKQAVDVLTSRKNRMFNKEYGIVGKTLMTCNPTQNFVRTEFYKPYEDQGAGRMQKWAFGEVIIPGTDELVTAYRAYIRSSVFDNPFIDRNYIEDLKTKPEREKKRLLYGDWNYADDADSLFNSLLLDRATAYELQEPEPPKPGEIVKFNKFIGVDIADKGNDETVASLIVNGVLVTMKELVPKLDEGETKKTTEKPLSYLIADELIKFAQQNGFQANQAKQIAIEGNGIGVGVRDAMKVRGWFISVYEATSQSRSEAYYNFSLDMDAGAVKIVNNLDDGELRRQLVAHTYIMDNQKPKVIPKEKLKLVLNRSPDQADSAMIANWIRRGGAGATDPKQSASRIRF